ncbi:MAG: hypothetical protein CSA62_04840 [Planctomycetota bacterium]|nr:MAG: hypothetical protein CSA62_04840 [Planctomycetota bacterium]
MSRLSLSLACACILSASASAQVAPGTITKSAPSTVFTYGSGGQIPGTGTGQIAHFRLPHNPLGTWTTCITVTSGLPSSNGGSGGYDLLMGVYDRVKGKFTPNLLAANLNSAGNDFGLMLDPKGMYAIFDRATGVYLASRKNLIAKFNAPVQVAGITQTYVDPALGYVGGKLKIFYTLNKNIVMQDLDLSTPSAPKVSGTPSIIVQSGATNTANSATPITGPDGDVEGLWFANLVGRDNDMCWKASLDPKDPFTVVVDTTTWINNGGVAGGLLTHAGPTNPKNAMYELKAAWLLGDVVSPGGTADVFGAFPRKNNLPGITAVFLSAGLLKTPVAVAPFTGLFGLDLKTFGYLSTMTHSDASDRAKMALPIPNNPSMKGVVVHLQGLSIDPTGKAYTLTNTGKITVK